MIQQVQPNRWSCLPTSLAMCLGIPVTEIFDRLQHDGSEILWPELPEPYRRRSFSLHEMIYVADLYKHALVTHEPSWYNCPADNVIRNFEPPAEYWPRILRTNWGILCGKTELEKPHAVAWDTKHIYDPNGTMYGPEKFQTELFLACCRLQK